MVEHLFYDFWLIEPMLRRIVAFDEPEEAQRDIRDVSRDFWYFGAQFRRFFFSRAKTLTVFASPSISSPQPPPTARDSLRAIKFQLPLGILRTNICLFRKLWGQSSDVASA